MTDYTDNMKRKVYFQGLNALRFFAAFAVLIFHSSQWYHYKFDTPFKMFLHNLPVAVDFFFILSGFLIIYLLLVEKQQTGKVNLKNFYIRRFLRIFPLYYLIIAISFLFLQDVKTPVHWSKFLYFWGNFEMIHNNAWTLASLNPLWSISIEEHFYLFIPFLVGLFPTKYLKYLFWTIILFSVGYRFYITKVVPNNWMHIYMHTLSQMDLLAIGGLLALQHFHQPFKFEQPTFIYLILLAAFIILLTLLDTKDYTTLYNATIKKYVFAVPLIFLLLFFIFSSNPAFDFIKHNRILNYFGKISYGIYLYNAMVIDQLARVNWLQNHYWIKLPLDIVLTLVLATLSFELFEKQFMKLKRRFQIVKTGN